MDEFEHRLSRQKFRQVPPEWRGEILAAGRGLRVEGREPEQRLPSTLISRLSTLLWPHPAAWAGLAATWILILAVDFSVRDKTPIMAETVRPPSPAVMAQLQQQQRLLAELMGPRDTRDADRSKHLTPQPRSERTKFEMV